MLGRAWRIEVAPILQSGGWWRATIEGIEHWYIAEAPDEPAITSMLLRTGVTVPDHSFAGTAFQHLVRHGLAERIDDRAATSPALPSGA